MREGRAKCESCLRGGSSWSWRYARGERPWYDRVAVFMCFVCQIYKCDDCMSQHKRAMMALDRSPELFSPRMNLCTNLVEVQKEMLKTKYQSSTTPSSFRGEEI